MLIVKGESVKAKNMRESNLVSEINIGAVDYQ